MRNHRLQEYLADISLITIALIWGSTFIIIKKSIDLFDPISFVFLRFTIASVFMLVFIIPLMKKINRKLLIEGGLLGTALFLIFLTQTLALKMITATEVGFLTGLYVIFVPILSAVFLKKYPHIFSWIGVSLAAAGMAIVTFQSGLSITAGQFLAIVNAFFIGVQILMTDVYSRKHNVVLLTAIQLITVAVLSGLYAFCFESSDYAKAFIPYVGWSIVFTGIFATVLCFFIQTAMLKYTTPTKAAIMFTLEPISSAFFAYFIGNEILSAKQYFGAALIIIAILTAEAGTALKHSKSRKN